MMTSTPVFSQRLISLGVERAALDMLLASGVDTLSKFAFCCNYNPNMPDDSNLVEFLTVTINSHLVNVGANVPALRPGLLASLRQAFFEAHTMMLGELKHRIERTEDAAPRKVPLPEKAARLDEQRLRLGGVVIAGPTQPSFALIDLVAQQKEDDCLKYIPYDLCTSRDTELRGDKKLLPSEVSSDLKIRQALQRRSLAYDQLKLISYAALESWITYLFTQTSRVTPDNFAPITLQQALQTDKQCFICMAELCRTGLAMDAQGRYPAELALVEARGDPMVIAMLQPMPISRTNPSPKIKVKPTVQKNAVGKAEPKAKAKGKGKGGKERSLLPKGLIGMHGKTEAGVNLCFDFNLRGCNNAVPGQSCGKGAHLCAKCFGAHAQHACPGVVAQ